MANIKIPDLSSATNVQGSDLLVLEQTGGTAKLKLEDLFAANADSIVMTSHTQSISVGSDAVAWSFNLTKSGYTPLLCGQIQHGYSLVTIVGLEGFNAGNGSLSISGFARCTDGVTRNIQIIIRILWKKN